MFCVGYPALVRDHKIVATFKLSESLQCGAVRFSSAIVEFRTIPVNSKFVITASSQRAVDSKDN